MAPSIECKRAPIVAVIAVLAICICITAVGLFLTNGKMLCQPGELFYEATSSCYSKGAQGPCNDTMILDETYMKSEYGGCSCAYAENDRALLYHKDTNQCYFIFSQGFCEDGYWVNMTASVTPFCEKNICLNKLEHEKDEEIVPLKGGTCAILNKKASGCVNAVHFVHPLVYPFCPTRSNRIKFSFGSVASVASHTPCPLGSYRNIMGYCTPKVGIDIAFNFN